MREGHAMSKKKLDLAAILEAADCRALAVRALKEALNAHRSFSQNGKTVTEPDYKTRVHAAAILLAYTDGKPVERQMIQFSDQSTRLSDEEHNEMIARALRLPPGRCKAILEAKAKAIGDSSPGGVSKT